MKTNTLLIGLLAATLTWFACLTAADASDRGSYSRYATPHVTALRNGSYLVTFRGSSRSVSFRRDLSVLTAVNCSRNDIERARKAVRNYQREQFTGDYHSPGHSQWPVVHRRRDGMLEVRMPSGGVVLYTRNGTFVRKGATVSSYDLTRADRAVQRYLHNR